MIETALVNILKADAGVNALVVGRIRPFTDTNTTAYPCLTYWRSNSERPFTNDGPTGQDIAQFQLDAWSNDSQTCWDVLDAARLATNGIRGVYSGVQIDSVRWIDQHDQINVSALPGRQKAIGRQTAIIVISFNEQTICHVPARGFSTAFA